MILGLMGFVGGIPAAIISPFAGVLADRTNPHRIIVTTQILSTLQAFLLAALVYFNQVNVWVIVALVCALGIINGVDTPVRQMFVGRLLSRKEDISSAVACNSMVYDAARILGPALGGFVLARYTEGPSFIVNGLSHSIVIALFLSIRLPSQLVQTKKESVRETLIQGVRYAIGVGEVRSILILSACISFAGIGYMVLMPIMAADVLKGGPNALGLLFSSVGVGAIIGGLFFSIPRSIAKHVQLICVGASLYGIGLLVFSQSRLIVLSALALSVAGFGIMVMMTACNTILITITDADKHGRVMSLFTLSYLGTAPLGSLCTGFLANQIGAPITITCNAILCLLAAGWFYSRIHYFKNLSVH